MLIKHKTKTTSTKDNMILITSKTCPPCKVVKAYIAEQNIEGIEVLDISEKAGMDLVIEHGLKAVPTLIDGEDVITSVDDIKDRLKAQ